ncbi:hypothetical protein ACRHK7_04230 [Weissella tructae]|uniref:Uncharacterized protein n=2 Tax=Weissella TaxID=46255 RepID=A0A075U4I2_9LACO|nr:MULTISPECIES: hypothetical protein [Weissella]AIG65057.1 hypothetical protein WS08_0118 [Weissella tructae]AIM62369.1 hypothetical protein WS74_0117 [Weissella ceti]AIM63707.1 hypothetical protein WS105_0117 [Weissella ceti]ELA07750.1 hypothetical protein WCNC_00677 [Weissella ceti NC36]QVV91459.1 hypothetical protein KHQ32_00685 [Weissella tructae]
MDYIDRFTRYDSVTWKDSDIIGRLQGLLKKEKTSVDILELITFIMETSLLKQKNNSELNEMVSSIKSSIYIWINQVDTDVMNETFGCVFEDNDKSYQYVDELVYLVNQFSDQLKVSDAEMLHLFEKYKVRSLLPWIKYKNVVTKYPETIKTIMLSDNGNIEYLINNFTDSKSVNYFPDNITKEEYSSMLDLYIDSDHPNGSLLEVVQYIPEGITGYLNLTSKRRLKLKKRIENLNSELMAHGHITKIGFNVYTDWVEYRQADEIKFFLDKDAISTNQNDNPTILNVLYYLEGLWTPNRILNLSSFPNIESSPLIEILTTKSKRYYNDTGAFKMKLELVLLQLEIIQSTLIEKDSSLENVLEYFFSEYTEAEGMKWLPLDIPTEGTYKNRNKALFPIEENIRKQWCLWVRNKEIDLEMLEFENTPNFSEISSVVEDKYIYASDKLKPILRMLFSDQSPLHYINKKINAPSFVELIDNHNLAIADFHAHQQTGISDLLDLDVVTLDAQNKISMTDRQKLQIYLFEQLWMYEVINKRALEEKINLPNYYQDMYHTMCDENLIFMESALYSKPEQNFLNYMLNNKMFDNSLAIRNGYGHDKIAEDGVYHRDYLVALLVILVHVMKINEELHYMNEDSDNDGFWSKLDPNISWRTIFIK